MLKAGQYAVSDGRFIVKQGTSWYVLDADCEIELGLLPTLASAKEYIADGVTSLGHHNSSPSPCGNRQRKKEFNAYLASEAKSGNYVPAILWLSVMFAICIFFLVVRGY
ncbi:hypothetical protein KJY73_18000 [Bowmanella sp. Y26]|nr:hypothetical protein [Bowmanella yangjiangensis]